MGYCFYIIPNVMSIQFDLRSIHLFFLSFFLLFFLFLSVFSLIDTNNSKDSKEGGGNSYFCFPLPPAHKHSFSSSRLQPVLYNRSITRLSWWDLFSLEICILFQFLLMQLSRSYWLWQFKVTFCEDLSSYQTTTLQLQTGCLKH